MAATGTGVSAAEATAPCRVGLGPSVAIALDRRAFARAERTAGGVDVDSKDTLLKVGAAATADLSEDGVPGLVRHVLEDLGVTSGIRVVTQARVPFETGLGSAGALAVAVGAAVARVLGKSLPPAELGAMARHGSAVVGADPTDTAGQQAALLGGVVTAAGRLPVDPARIEECLILIDASAPPPRSGAEASISGPSMALLVPGGEEAAEGSLEGALQEARFSDVAHILWSHPNRPASEAEASSNVRRIAALAAERGGLARPLWPGPKSLVLVWAEPGARGPGPKERILEALAAGGHRVFPCRVDLRGLEVEDAAGPG